MRPTPTFANFVCCVILLCGANKLAGATDKVSLERLIEAACERAPERLTLQTELAIARAEESALGQIENPELRLGYDEETDLATTPNKDANRGYQAAIRLYPPNPWKAKAERALGRAGIDLAQARLDSMDDAVAATVARLYHTLQYSEAGLQAQIALVTLQSERLAQTLELTQKGQGTLEMEMDARVRELDARMDLDRERAKVTAIAYELAKLTGLPTTAITLPQPPESVDSNLAGMDLSELLEKAHSQRSEYAVYHALRAGSGAALDATNAEKYPWFSHVQAGYGVRNNFGDRDEVSVSIAISLPVFSWNERNTAPARTAMQAYNAEAAAFRIYLEHAVRQAFESVQTAKTRLDTYKAETADITDRLEATLATLSDRSDLGTSSAAWSARQGLLNVQRMRWQLEMSYALAILDLSAAVGENP